MVGRSGERQQLRATLEHVTRGKGRICTLAGPAGIGKTRLVTETLATAGRRGFQVLYGGGAELEYRRPFGAVVDCLGIRPNAGDEQRSRIASLLVGTGTTAAGIPTEAATTEFRVVESILALVEELCAQGPVAMAVDDLQWADPSTLLLLHRLARYVPALPILLICCWRPLPRRPDLDRLAESMAAAGSVAVVLRPLAGPDVVEMLQASTGADPGANLCRLAAGAGGNPLFVTELLGALEREGALNYSGRGQVDVASPSLPPSLPVAILHRLSYLSEEALEVLRVAAILGSRVDVTDIGLLRERPTTSLLSPIRELRAAGILDDQDGRLAFHHDLIREALYYDLPGPVRAALHRDAALALAAAGSPAGRVAEHAARGAIAGDPFAVEWLHRAATDAASRAPAVAVDWLDQALELASADDPRRDRLAADRAVSLLWSGRVAEAEAACRILLAGRSDPALACRVEFCLAQALFARGRGEEAVDIAEAAGRRAPWSSEGAQIRAWVSLGNMAIGRMEQAVEGADATLAEPLADELATAVALTTKATAIGFGGRLQESVDVQERAIAVANSRPGAAAHRFPLYFFHAMFLVEVDDLGGARRALTLGRQVSEEIGARWNLPLYAWASAWVRFVAGEWDDALAECEASVALADELGTRHGVLLAHALESMIALHRGELERAERAVAAAEAEFAATGPQHGLENVMTWARALVAEASGDVAGATVAMSRVWDELRMAGVAGYRLDLGPDLIRLAVATGEPTLAEAAAAEVEQVAAMNPTVVRTQGTALLCRGLVTASPRLLDEAATLLERCARPFEAARACEEAAVALARAGDRTAARERGARALRRFEGLEAWRAVGHAEARMREHGVRGRSRRRQPRPTTGWASLTTTERTVAELAASGLTNPQIAGRLFVSRHTVHTHVAHVLAKLHLSSRVELAAEVAVRRAKGVGEDPEELQPADEGHRGPALDRYPT